ncbi:MAG: glycosyltransferase family 2 protein [Chloroflexaceae bacterium]|nr:glycosyltransferase family 2 protein [Chloroflexaceae bacterium]
MLTLPQETEADLALDGISIVIPAYNEEHGIDGVLTQLAGVMAESGWPYEIIIVDDGSQDGTAEQVHKHQDVILISHRTNRGYGAALKTGTRHARYDVVCITDADGTYPNEQIPDLLAHMVDGNHDMVVGSRTGQHVAIPLVRRPAKWVVGKLANFVAGEPIPDINSGLRLFRRSIALSFWNILPDGFSFTTTITLVMLTNNYLVDYVPISYHARIGKAKIKPIRETLQFYSYEMRSVLYFVFLKSALPLSGLLLLLGIGWGLFSTFVLGQLADVSTLVILMTAIQVAVAGLLADLIDRRVQNPYRNSR